LPEEQGRNVQLLNPQSIRFSQASIKATFQDGTSIYDLAAKLRSGRIRPHDVPAIRVFEHDGKFFTLDNRRLEAFRRAGVDVPVRMASPQKIADEASKFTTQNDGVSIRIRGA
jgi:hypothetical protein